MLEERAIRQEEIAIVQQGVATRVDCRHKAGTLEE